MPHVPTVNQTDHDRHDPLLVAALAADDLAGTDRDQALALIGSCADCASLHDDLQAIARATATVPPPTTTLPRDFRLTVADAARLRPTGWRRLTGWLSSPGPIAAPLGVALATMGLVGLLLGNVSFGAGFGAAGAAAPAAAPAENQGAGGASVNDAAAPSAAPAASAGGGGALAPVPAASGATASRAAADSQYGSVPSPSGDSKGELITGAPGASRGAIFGGLTPAPSVTKAGGGTASVAEPEGAAAASTPSLGTLVFVAAIVLGLILLVLSRRRRPRLG
jgi:hypothetical protein